MSQAPVPRASAGYGNLVKIATDDSDDDDDTVVAHERI